MLQVLKWIQVELQIVCTRWEPLDPVKGAFVFKQVTQCSRLCYGTLIFTAWGLGRGKKTKHCKAANIWYFAPGGGWKTHFNGEAKDAGRVSTSCSMILKEGGSAILNHKQTHLSIVSLIANSPWALSRYLSLSLFPSDWLSGCLTDWISRWHSGSAVQL